MEGDALRGHLELLLLAALGQGDQHGYALIEWLRARSDGALDSAREASTPPSAARGCRLRVELVARRRRPAQARLPPDQAGREAAAQRARRLARPRSHCRARTGGVVTAPRRTSRAAASPPHRVPRRFVAEVRDTLRRRSRRRRSAEWPAEAERLTIERLGPAARSPVSSSPIFAAASSAGSDDRLRRSRRLACRARGGLAIAIGAGAVFAGRASTRPGRSRRLSARRDYAVRSIPSTGDVHPLLVTLQTGVARRYSESRRCWSSRSGFRPASSLTRTLDRPRSGLV